MKIDELYMYRQYNKSINYAIKCLLIEFYVCLITL